MRDLLFRVDQVISNEIDVARHQLMRNGVDILTAQAAFVDHVFAEQVPIGQPSSSPVRPNRFSRRSSAAPVATG